ncbi:MAG: hypothetical protein ACTSXH_08125 [Promethearchaeota archaeon]
MANNKYRTSIIPVHRIFMIFTEEVYLKRETPAKSAAPYPHFTQQKAIILNFSSILFNPPRVIL